MDLDARRSSKSTLYPSIHYELGANESSSHNHTGTEAGEEALGTGLFGENDETVDHGAFRAVTLVDLRQQGVGGLLSVSCFCSFTHLGENGSRETGDDTGGESDGKLRRLGEVLPSLLAHRVVDGLSSTLIDSELSDSVRDLLAEDGDEAGVEAAETFSAEDLGEARPQTVRVLVVSDTLLLRAQTLGSDTRRIRVASAGVRRMSAKNLRHVRAGCCMWHSLGDGGTSEVDGRAVLDSFLVRTTRVYEVLLLHRSQRKPAVRGLSEDSRPLRIRQTWHHPGGYLSALVPIHQLLQRLFFAKRCVSHLQVTDCRGTEPSKQSASAFLRNDGAAGAEETLSFEGGVDLDTGFNNVDRCHRTMGAVTRQRYRCTHTYRVQQSAPAKKNCAQSQQRSGRVHLPWSSRRP